MADNFLKKTMKNVREQGYAWPDDVLSIQSSDLRISVGRFEDLAGVANDHRGPVHVAMDLMIIMRDGGWFFRTTKANNIVWEYAKPPVVLDRNDDETVRALEGQGWESLSTIQRYLDKEAGL